jgi:hypothetical protein
VEGTIRGRLAGSATSKSIWGELVTDFGHLSAHLIENHVRVNDKVVTWSLVELGMIGVTDLGQNGFETWKVPAQVTLLESTRNVVSYISLAQYYWSGIAMKTTTDALQGAPSTYH